MENREKMRSAIYRNTLRARARPLRLLQVLQNSIYDEKSVSYSCNGVATAATVSSADLRRGAARLVKNRWKFNG
jgi:hypothetical protein